MTESEWLHHWLSMTPPLSIETLEAITLAVEGDDDEDEESSLVA